MIRGPRRRTIVRVMLNNSRAAQDAMSLYRGDWHYPDLSTFLDKGDEEQIAEVEAAIGIKHYD